MQTNKIEQYHHATKIICGFFIILTIWWLSMAARNLTDGTENNAFTLIYPWASLFGGILGLLIARKWGGLKSYFGSSIVFFSLGLLAQFFGQASYAWLIYIKGIEVPYPSIGDVGYYGSVLFYIIGAAKLIKVIKPPSTSKKFIDIFPRIGIPLAMVVLSYAIFLSDYQFISTPKLTIFLDFAYPLSQAIYVSLAITIYLSSRRILGGIMRIPTLFLLTALVVQYVCDFMFLYQSKAGSWYVGGINDYLYLLAYYIMTIALITVGRAFKKIQQPDGTN